MSTMHDSPRRSPPIRLLDDRCTRGKASMARLPGTCTDCRPGTGRQARTGSQARPQPSTGPKPKPKPKPSPKPAPAQPVAATAKPRPKRPSHDCKLPAIPLTSADVPPGAAVLLGTLVRGTRWNGRPMFLLRVPCECKKGRHLTTGEVIGPSSLRPQPADQHCKKYAAGGVWLALYPEQLEASRQAYKEGCEAFDAWKAERANKIVPTPKEPTP